MARTLNDLSCDEKKLLVNDIIDKKNGTSDTRAYSSKKEMFEASDILKMRTDITECYWTSIEDIETKNYIIKKEETKTKQTNNNCPRNQEHRVLIYFWYSCPNLRLPLPKLYFQVVPL